MRYRSAPADLALHGARILGFPTAAGVAARWDLNPGAVQELLLDHEAAGWVRQLSFAGSSGWSLTEAGRSENERRLATELEQANALPVVTAVRQAFRPLNRRFGAACTDWQLRPARGDPMAVNDHTDWRWDDRVLQTLASVASAFGQLCGQLTEYLARFDGYAGLYSASLASARSGQRSWVDAPDRDSCHLVWIQFHEDLLATLGIPRGSDN